MEDSQEDVDKSGRDEEKKVEDDELNNTEDGWEEVELEDLLNTENDGEKDSANQVVFVTSSHEDVVQEEAGKVVDAILMSLDHGARLDQELESSSRCLEQFLPTSQLVLEEEKQPDLSHSPFPDVLEHSNKDHSTGIEQDQENKESQVENLTRPVQTIQQDFLMALPDLAESPGTLKVVLAAVTETETEIIDEIGPMEEVDDEEATKETAGDQGMKDDSGGTSRSSVVVSNSEALFEAGYMAEESDEASKVVVEESDEASKVGVEESDEASKVVVEESDEASKVVVEESDEEIVKVTVEESWEPVAVVRCPASAVFAAEAVAGAEADARPAPSHPTEAEDAAILELRLHNSGSLEDGQAGLEDTMKRLAEHTVDEELFDSDAESDDESPSVTQLHEVEFGVKLEEEEVGRQEESAQGSELKEWLLVKEREFDLILGDKPGQEDGPTESEEMCEMDVVASHNPPEHPQEQEDEHTELMDELELQTEILRDITQRTAMAFGDEVEQLEVVEDYGNIDPDISVPASKKKKNKSASKITKTKKKTPKSPMLKRSEIKACIDLHHACENADILKELIQPAVNFGSNVIIPETLENKDGFELELDRDEDDGEDYLKDTIEPAAPSKPQTLRNPVSTRLSDGHFLEVSFPNKHC